LKQQVYDRSQISLGEFVKVLNANFDGHESLRQRLLNKTPKYGNDDDYADSVMRAIFEAYYDAVDSRPTAKGGKYRINMLPTTVHVYFGKMVGATADGRKAREPLSEGVSPVQGADRKGPTAVVKSASKIDHIRTGGTLLNQKFAPELLEDENGLQKLASLIRTYFKLDGHHIQFNVVNSGTLRDAQKYPEKYGDLLVRVAGYSDYFVNLSTELQDEIIKRTEHKSF
jgi:formate C-acetyltransferase